MNLSRRHGIKIGKDEKLFHLKETKDIIVLSDKIKWWDNFHIENFAKYIKARYRYHLSKINMN